MLVLACVYEPGTSYDDLSAERCIHQARGLLRPSTNRILPVLRTASCLLPLSTWLTANPQLLKSPLLDFSRT